MLALIINAFADGIDKKRAILLVYIVKLIFSCLILCIIGFLIIPKNLSSINFTDLLIKFQFNNWMDFIRINKIYIKNALNLFLWLILIWIIISSLINNGYIRMVGSHTRISSANFIKMCFHKWLSYFFIQFSTILIGLIFGTFILWVTFYKLELKLETYPSEKPIVIRLIIGISSAFLLFFACKIWANLSSIAMIHKNMPYLTAVKKGFIEIWQNGFRILKIIFTILMVEILIVLGMKFMTSLISNDKIIGLLVTIFILQFIIILRILLKYVYYYCLMKTVNQK